MNLHQSPDKFFTLSILLVLTKTSKRALFSLFPHKDISETERICPNPKPFRRRKKMASAVSMSVPVTVASQKVLNKQPTITSDSFFRPLPIKQSKKSVTVSSNKFQVRASFKEKAISGLTAGVLTASMVVPQVAEAAAGSGVSPSLKNFLLSIVAGGVVLVAIGGAVVGVSYFDPVKRG